MTPDDRTRRSGSRRRHDLEILAIPLGLLLVMTVLAVLDTVRPSLF